MHRRTSLYALLALAAGSVSAQEAPWPNKPVKIIVGYQAGGPTDLVARMLATKLQASLGQPFIVENKPGAGSNLATEAVANAAPDGYTVLLAAAPITMNGLLYKGLKWDVQTSFEPVSMVMSAPAVLAVAPHVPVRNLQELIALAKAKPGTLTFGSTGNGGSQHIAGELLKQRAGIDLTHVPYRGAAGALQDLMAGQISMAFMTAVTSVPVLQSGKVKPIAVAGPKRLTALPDVPTMAEAGLPGFEADSWNGFLLPKGTPPAIVARLQAEVVQAVHSLDTKSKLEAQGAIVVGSSAAEFRTTLAKEVRHWSETLKRLNIKMD